MYIKYNKNPQKKRRGDCVIRAIATVQDKDWEEVYMQICLQGLTMADMPDANDVWGKYLIDCGYKREIIPVTCPDCYTVEKFADEHPNGRYVLALDGHVVAVIDGNYYDTWNSGEEVPVYYWEKEN